MPLPTNNLLILTWNANIISTNSLELLNFLNKYSVDVACITETKLSLSKKLHFKNYKVFRINHTAHGGSVTIIVKKDIEVEALSCETIGIKIFPKSSKPVNIFSIYSSPLDMDISSFPSLFSANIPTLPFPCCCCGDHNAKNTA